MNCLRKGKPLRNSPYWLKHRNTGTSEYWVRMGQRLVSHIERRKSSTVKGQTFLRFDSKEAYLAKISELVASGEKVL